MKKHNKRSILTLEIGLICALLLSPLSLMTVADEQKAASVNNDYSFIITNTDFSGVEFSLSINDYSLETIEVEGTVFDRLHLRNGGYTADYGKAELPSVSFYAAIPQGAEVNLNYEVSDFTLLQDYYIYPSQPPRPETGGYVDPPFTINESFYSMDEYYPESIIQFSPIMVMRGCRIVMINVFPFVYNPVTESLKIYDEVSVDIDFIGGTEEFIPERYRSIYFQPLYDAYLLNSNNLERAPLHNPIWGSGPLSTGDQADLLIVVYDDFYEEILPLAEWRHKTGLETKVVKWSDIGTTAEDLRDYVSSTYYSWELPPSFLLIVGEADHIPVNYLYTHPYQGTKTGTDHWYVSFEGNDYLPELHTGRISVEDEVELTTVVNKILDYSKNPYMDKNWFDDILLAACEEYGRYFVWTSETIYDYLTPLGYNCIRQYEGGNPPGSTQGVIDAINNGVIIANHRDHGASQNDGYDYTGWSHPYFTTDHILNDINNGEMYPIVFSLNCDSGWFDGETDSYSGNYESIGEVGIRVAGRGFVSVIAATRVSYSGYNDELCRGFYDGMFSGFDPDYPNGGSSNPYDTEVFKMSMVMNYGKFWMYDKYIVPGGCPPYPWTPTEANSRVTFEMFHVHGDPTMEVWTAFPQNLNVNYELVIPTLSVTVKSDGTSIEGALVCLTQEEGFYIKGLTDSSGNVDLDTTSAVMGEEATLVVTAHNYLYFAETFKLNQPPEIPKKPEGPTTGLPHKEYTFTTSTTDPDGDQVYYKWRWGDGHYSEWSDPYNSGETASASHRWSEVATYKIWVKAKDIYGAETDWSEPLSISITKSKNRVSHNTLFLRILEELMDHFPLLKHFLLKIL